MSRQKQMFSGEGGFQTRSMPYQEPPPFSSNTDIGYPPLGGSARSANRGPATMPPAFTRASETLVPKKVMDPAMRRAWGFNATPRSSTPGNSLMPEDPSSGVNRSSATGAVPPGDVPFYWGEQSLRPPVNGTSVGWDLAGGGDRSADWFSDPRDTSRERRRLEKKAKRRAKKQLASAQEGEAPPTPPLAARRMLGWADGGAGELDAPLSGRSAVLASELPYDYDSAARVDAVAAFRFTDVNRNAGGNDGERHWRSSNDPIDDGQVSSTTGATAAPSRDEMATLSTGNKWPTSEDPMGAVYRQPAPRTEAAALGTPPAHTSPLRRLPSGASPPSVAGTPSANMPMQQQQRSPARVVLSTPPRVRSYAPLDDASPQTAQNIAIVAANGVDGGRPWRANIPIPERAGVSVNHQRYPSAMSEELPTGRKATTSHHPRQASALSSLSGYNVGDSIVIGGPAAADFSRATMQSTVSFEIPSEAPAAERLLYAMLEQSPSIPAGRSAPGQPVTPRSPGGLSLAAAAAVAQSPSARSIGPGAGVPVPGGPRPGLGLSSQQQLLVKSVLRDKDREILSLRGSLALAYRCSAYAIHRHSGKRAPSSPNSLSMMESRFLAAAARSVVETDPEKPLLLVDRPPPHIQGLPSVPMPLGITYSVGQVSGILSILNVDDMFHRKKPTRIFLRSWKPRFVVADDRGIAIYPSEEDFKQHSFQRALVVAPYADLEYFVPSFRQMASVEGDDLLDYTRGEDVGSSDRRRSPANRESTRRDRNHRDGDGSAGDGRRRRAESKSGLAGLFSRLRPSSGRSRSGSADSSWSHASGSDDAGWSPRRSRSANDGVSGGARRMRASRATKDLHAELMARIALQYANDTQFTYFGFIAKQPGSVLNESKPANPPLIFRTESWQQHTEWVHFLAQCFNKRLYRQMFPNASTETLIGMNDKEVQTEHVEVTYASERRGAEAGDEVVSLRSDGSNATAAGVADESDAGGVFNKGIQTEVTTLWEAKESVQDSGAAWSMGGGCGRNSGEIPVEVHRHEELLVAEEGSPLPPGATPPAGGIIQEDIDGAAGDAAGVGALQPTSRQLLLADTAVSSAHAGVSDGGCSTDNFHDMANAGSSSMEMEATSLVEPGKTTEATGEDGLAWHELVRELRETLERKNTEIEQLQESLRRWQSHASLLDRHVHELRDEKALALEQAELVKDVLSISQQEVRRLRGAVDATPAEALGNHPEQPDAAKATGNDPTAHGIVSSGGSRPAGAATFPPEEKDKAVQNEEELRRLRDVVVELARDRQLLEAELLAVRDGSTEGLKALARQALADIDVLHGAYTAQEYLDSILEVHKLRGYRKARVSSTPRGVEHEYGMVKTPLRDPQLRSSAAPHDDCADLELEKVLPPPMALPVHSVIAGSDSPSRTPPRAPPDGATRKYQSPLLVAGTASVQRGGGPAAGDFVASTAVPADRTAADYEPAAGRRGRTGAGERSDKAFAMLLLTHADGEVIDGCLTVDEEEARLLSSGPVATQRGRQWSVLHHDTAALFVLTLSLTAGALEAAEAAGAAGPPSEIGRSNTTAPHPPRSDGERNQRGSPGRPVPTGPHRVSRGGAGAPGRSPHVPLDSPASSGGSAVRGGPKRDTAPRVRRRRTTEETFSSKEKRRQTEPTRGNQGRRYTSTPSLSSMRRPTAEASTRAAAGSNSSTARTLPPHFGASALFQDMGTAEAPSPSYGPKMVALSSPVSPTLAVAGRVIAPVSQPTRASKSQQQS